MSSALGIRPAGSDEAELLLEIHRASAVAGFAHIFAAERYPFPDDEVRERWEIALSDPNEDVVVAELDGGSEASRVRS